jgi:hypothetical protein
VPLLVVSAYTPAGYVDNANHDFGSILNFIETKYQPAVIDKVTGPQGCGNGDEGAPAG